MTAKKVNLNRAGIEELRALPGIGPQLAERIVEYRESTGPFSAPSDLAAVPGISERMVGDLQERVTVSTAEDAGNGAPGEGGGGGADPPWSGPEVGQMYGPYRIEERFARGRTGDIYRAYDVEEERYLALKVLSGTFAPDSDVVKDFGWSGRAVAGIEHPHIVKIETMGLTPDGQLYLAMPYVPGQSLAERLAEIRQRREDLSPAEALALVRPVVQALVAAHRAGVVHMMLTPGKIIIGADGLPRLLGLDTPATLYDLPAQDGDDPARYLSPEQRQGRVLDSRSNIYSLGAMLYELLTAERWEGESLSTAAEAWRDLPEMTRHVVATCLRPKPWARFRTTEELLLALDTALLNEASVAPDSLPSVAGAELSSIVDEANDLEEAAKGPPPGKAGKERRLWPYPLIALSLLLVGLLLFRPQRGTSTPVDDADAELLEQPVGQETLDALASPQSLQLTPTLSVLGNMLTARALAAPALPGVAATPTFIPTPTATPTDTPTPTPTPTDTPTPTNTPTPTPTPTFTRIPPTRTPVPTATFTPAPIIATETPSPPPPPPPPPSRDTATPKPPPTATPKPPPTATPPLPSGG